MSRISKRQIISITLVVVALAAFVYVWHRHNTKPVAKTTSKQASAQSNFTSGNAHENSTNTGVTQGSATDNKGDASATQGETGTSSASGVVTVVSPAKNGMLTSGDVIRGTAAGARQVQYRLIDDNVGVVAQGGLDVVNGTFSGKLQFKAHASTGRLDVYTLNEQGQETNEVQLQVGLGS
jgi:hypothetical protein